MVEHVGLNLFVQLPLCGAGKEVELDGDAVVGGLQVAHQQGHVVAHPGEVVQVGIEVGPEHAQVGLPAAVHQDAVVNLLLRVVRLDDLFRLVDVVGQQLDAAILIQHLRCAEAHAVHVDIHRPLHPSATTLLHAAPVLERVADQQIGGDGGDGIVPVAHLHRIECHLNHRTVGPIFRHGNPVAHLQHVVGRELHARYHAHDGVLEDEHQHGGRGSQSGQQREGRLVEQQGDDDDASHKPECHLHRLQQSLQGSVAKLLLGAIDRVDGFEQGVDKAEEGDEDEDVAEAAYQAERHRLHPGKGHGDGDGEHQGGHHAAEVHQHTAVEEDVIPRHACTFHQGSHHAQQDDAADKVHPKGEEQQQGKHHHLIQPVGPAGRQSAGQQPAVHKFQEFHIVSFIAAKIPLFPEISAACGLNLC